MPTVEVLNPPRGLAEELLPLVVVGAVIWAGFKVVGASLPGSTPVPKVGIKVSDSSIQCNGAGQCCPDGYYIDAPVQALVALGSSPRPTGPFCVAGSPPWLNTQFRPIL